MQLPPYDLNPPDIAGNWNSLGPQAPAVPGENTSSAPACAPPPVMAERVGSDPRDELIADVLAGDRKAIAGFVETYTDVVHHFLSRRIDQAEAVEDLCQEVFLAAWTQLPRFRHESSLKTWLCAIARHKVADFYRQRLQEAPHDAWGKELGAPLEPVMVEDFEGHIDRQKVDWKIREILSTMSEAYRAILRWRYWNHRTVGEIAKLSGKTEKAAERLLARARDDFAKRWNLE